MPNMTREGKWSGSKDIPGIGANEEYEWDREQGGENVEDGEMDGRWEGVNVRWVTVTSLSLPLKLAFSTASFPLSTWALSLAVATS